MGEIEILSLRIRRGRTILPQQMLSQPVTLDLQGGTESPGAIVRVRTVVIEEDLVIAAIAEEGAAEFSDIRRCLHPARRFQIELSEFLQFSILFFG
jgi:hypothetical protein